MSKPTDERSPQTHDNIDQIRDIIFGPQKREFDERLEKLSSNFNRFKEEIHHSTAELRDSLSNQITAGDSALDQRLQRMSAKLEEEAADIRNHLGQTEKQFQAALGGQGSGAERRSRGAPA